MTLVRDFHFPFIKIKSFTTPETNLNEPVDGLEVLLEQKTAYDVSLVRSHLKVVAPDFESRITRRFDGVPTPPNPTKPVRILVHLHLEHLEETPYFVSKLIHIRTEFDLYVTVLRLDPLVSAQIMSFDQGATIIELPDVGDDVLAFLHVIKLADLNNYGYVIKMHSTGIRFDHGKLADCDLYAYGWRNALVDALLESEALFQRHLAEMNGNPRTGMTASPLLLSAEMREATEEKKSLVSAWTREMSLRPAAETSPVVIGRMFLMRAPLCSPLLSLDSRKIELARSEGRLAAETLEHAFEKILALLLDHGNATVGKPNIRTGPDPIKQPAEHSRAVSRRPGKLRHCLQFRYLKFGQRIGIYDKEQYKSLRRILKLEILEPDEGPP
jgi:lipopolysaccharide biosynthesis protein